MLTFFSSIGLSSDFSRLIKGGKPLVLLTIAVTILIAIQKYCRHEYGCHDEWKSIYWLSAGSITLTGGHGNAEHGAPILADKYGVTGAVELAMASSNTWISVGWPKLGPCCPSSFEKGLYS